MATSTIRSRLAQTLTQEILNRGLEGPFLIESEHQLCRRFNVSRVTVRLALSDLEQRGLIFRRHGKGTFAHGQQNRTHKAVGIWYRQIPREDHWPVLEIIRGVQSALASLSTNAILTHISPAEWSSEMLSSLGSVLIFPSGITEPDLDFLKNETRSISLHLGNAPSGNAN